MLYNKHIETNNERENTMKRSELFEKFAACVKMVEDSGHPNCALYRMVKFGGSIMNNMPIFDDEISPYTFAIGIIGSTPVFVGDTVYHERNGECVITKMVEDCGSKYFYYNSPSINSERSNSQLSAFSLIAPNTITLVDVKPFAIFNYDGQEVMILPAGYDFKHNVKRLIMTGVCGDFGAPFSTSAKTQAEMYEYLTTPNEGCNMVYVKTDKRFGLIEG